MRVAHCCKSSVDTSINRTNIRFISYHLIFISFQQRNRSFSFKRRIISNFDVVEIHMTSTSQYSFSVDAKFNQSEQALRRPFLVDTSINRNFFTFISQINRKFNSKPSETILFMNDWNIRYQRLNFQHCKSLERGIQTLSI